MKYQSGVWKSCLFLARYNNMHNELQRATSPLNDPITTGDCLTKWGTVSGMEMDKCEDVTYSVRNKVHFRPHCTEAGWWSGMEAMSVEDWLRMYSLRENTLPVGTNSQCMFAERGVAEWHWCWQCVASTCRRRKLGPLRIRLWSARQKKSMNSLNPFSM